MESLIQLATHDLTRRLAIDTAAVRVICTEARTWPDSSLGCPRPGMKYRQVPVDGYRILLAVGNDIYAYHGGGGRGPFLCPERPRGPPLSD
jgi:hypothetical protein